MITRPGTTNSNYFGVQGLVLVVALVHTTETADSFSGTWFGQLQSLPGIHQPAFDAKLHSMPHSLKTCEEK
jgi:hypothetical protein